jgi:hypothetical protein
MRRRLGFKLTTFGEKLMSFINYLEDTGETVLTTRAALAWATDTPRSTDEVHWSRRLMVVRTFARHLKTLEPATEIPPDDALPHHYRRITPHLFTPAELDRLLAATGSLGPAFRARTWHTFLGLLAVSGLRTSEACGLDRTDVDLTGGLLTVRDTKFGKSRQVPVHASTVTALRRYARERHMDAMLDHDEHGTVVVGGVHKWVLEGNWKLAAEQFATDWYHVNMSHASALMVLSPSGKKPNAEVVHRSGRQYSDANGNGAGFPVHPKNFDFSVWPINWRLAAGHLLRLRLSGGAVDYFQAPTPTPATVTVHLNGPDPSYIELPIRTRG